MCAALSHTSWTVLSTPATTTQSLPHAQPPTHSLSNVRRVPQVLPVLFCRARYPFPAWDPVPAPDPPIAWTCAVQMTYNLTIPPSTVPLALQVTLQPTSGDPDMALFLIDEFGPASLKAASILVAGHDVTGISSRFLPPGQQVAIQVHAVHNRADYYLTVDLFEEGRQVSDRDAKARPPPPQPPRTYAALQPCQPSVTPPPPILRIPRRWPVFATPFFRVVHM